VFRNYIKVTLRNILRHKGYSLINITGLAIGMACCLLISIWVLDELSYDRFHEHAEDLYRVEENQHYSGRNFHVTVTPYPLAPALREEIPEITEATRVVWAGGQLFRYGEQAFFENNVRAVDPSFLQMFTFPLIQGDPDTALDSPHSLLITEKLAEKYFGTDDAMGKVLSINNQHQFTVTGVLRDVPHNSTLQFDILIPYVVMEKQGRTSDSFLANSILTIVQLQPGTPKQLVDEKILGFIRTKEAESRTDLELMPYTRIHLHSYWGYAKDPGAVRYIYIFSIIAVFVLLIACINFMNLTTARSAGRAKEVGLRKVVGAVKGDLVRQFFGESVVYAFSALILAVLLVILVLPAFSRLAAKELSWRVAGLDLILLGLGGITLFTGLVAGSYPALFLSSFQPVKVLKGSLKSGAGSARFRKILVVVQFSLSVSLMIGTTVVYKQLNYMQSKSLGWNKEHLVYIPLRADMRTSYSALKQELVKDSRILGVTGANYLPSNIGSNSSGADWDGKDPEFNRLIGQTYVDYDYCDMLGIEIVEGRGFSHDYPTDESSGFLVNQAVARLMDKPTALGERFSFMGTEGHIIGVMKDFHYGSMRQEIEPLAIRLRPQNVVFALIRLGPGKVSTGLDFIEATWKRVIPTYPFESHFIDEEFDRMYRAEERIGAILRTFTFLAVFIACLGLFGLASFTAEQRTREIGIRKVLGASISQVTLLLCREFLVLVVAANLLAWPLAYYVMGKWLRGYAYRTGLNWPLFLGALILALAVAVLSVGFQALRAAYVNPAESLKYE